MNEETLPRLVSFIAVFVLLASAERYLPRRVLNISRAKRWFANLGLLALNPVSVYLIFPLLPVGMSLWAQEQGWGLFHLVKLPYVLNVVITIVVLDFVVYFQHVFFHAVPLLWRLHMVHHADMNFDVTTGVRFHPFEIIISMGLKLSVVVLLGAPPLGVLLFEIMLNAASMFNHSNIHIPVGFDRFLRLLVVTPDMHRVHHSVIIRETNSNYGFDFPWWDRIFGTYKAQPEKGHLDMTIGISRYREQEKLGLGRLLTMPFVEKPGPIPINKH